MSNMLKQILHNHLHIVCILLSALWSDLISVETHERNSLTEVHRVTEAWVSSVQVTAEVNIEEKLQFLRILGARQVQN